MGEDNSMSDSSTKKSHADGRTARKADFIDKHVGQRIRDRRRTMDISQQEISEILSVSYQQLQKYESGQNRVSAGRLFLLAHILKVDVGFFYQGLCIRIGSSLQRLVVPIESAGAVRNIA